jgi:hypothetical protein
MPYDVFISYTKDDRPWAERLHRELFELGLDAFWDRSSLKAGENWNNQLERALAESNNLVVLWSTKAKENDWVDHEATMFYQGLWKFSAQPVAIEQKMIEQKMIYVYLDRDFAPYRHIQGVTEFRETGVYALGADKVSAELWTRVVTRVYDAVKNSSAALGIPLLIFAATKDQINKVVVDQRPGFLKFASCLAELLKGIGMKHDQLLSQYDVNRSDWRPFGGTCTIKDMLDHDRLQMNKLPNAMPFRWEYIGEKFWSQQPADRQAIEAEVAKLLRPNLAVVVIDPISFYVPEIYGSFDMIKDCFDNENAIIIVLSPATLPESCRNYREALRNLEGRIFNQYYTPGIKIPYAPCNVSFGDELDIQRSVLAVIRRHFNEQQSVQKHPMVSV